MTDHSPYDEKKLLEETGKGNELAFRAILNRYWDTMYGNILHLCKRQEAAVELTQDLFLAVWQNRSKLHEVQRFDAYLYAIARNLVIDSLRRKVLPLLDSSVFDPYFHDDGLTGIDIIELKELQSVLHQAIAELPPQMQKAFTLHRIQGLSHEDVAREMNISRFSSQTYVARAMVLLRASLAQYYGKAGIMLMLFYL